MIDWGLLALGGFIVGCAGLLAIFIRALIRLERLERYHHEEHELLDPDIRKKGPR